MPAFSDGPQARLLAYGGTAFLMRNRIGKWPPIPDGPLQDRYGLFNGIAFGVGHLNRRAFVILRQHQNLEYRGGYAYTLLIDPGEVVWHRFQWNGAALMRAILNHAELAHRLLQDVESCVPGEIDVLMARLEPHERRGTIRDDLAALLTGAGAAADTMVIEGRISIEDVDAAIDTIPVPFRGQGFLVGGCQLHGRVFGSRLVWDDERGRTSPGLDGLAARGRELLGAWRDLGRFNDHRLTAFADKPAWQWPPEMWTRLNAFAGSHPGHGEALLNLRRSLSSTAAQIQYR